MSSFAPSEFKEALGSRLHAVRAGVETLPLLLVGDVVGRPGRKVLKKGLEAVRAALPMPLPFVSINGENLAGGFGITSKIFEEVTAPGQADVVTMGNHWSDKPDVHAIRRASPRLVLPQNLLDLEGVGEMPIHDLPGGRKKVVVLNLMGNFAMKDAYGDPFAYVERRRALLVEMVRSGGYVVVVDVHAEASSEKQALAWFLDGVAAALVGTHTHTPTSDERVTPRGTAFLTDVGMTGPYRSVIGMEVERSLRRYFGAKEKRAQEVADGDAWFCAFLVETDASTGLAVAAHRLQYREDASAWRISSCYL